MSKAALLEKLTDKAYRDAFVSEEIDTGVPMQLRAMREGRGWKQTYVAQKTGTKQPRFSLMEKPGYGKFSLNTLKKLAALFDVGLVVSFVPFSEMIDFVEGMTPKRLTLPSFADEYMPMHRRFTRERGRHDELGAAQGTLAFVGASASAEPVYDDTGSRAIAIVDASVSSHDFHTDVSGPSDLTIEADWDVPAPSEYSSQTARIE